MANIKSQIKRNRQNEKRRLRNRMHLGKARAAVKRARQAMLQGTPDARQALLEAVSALDRAAERGVIHKNNAARRKSRLMKAFASLQAAKEQTSESKTEVSGEQAPNKAAARQKTEK
ncbi:MAG: 30S ribosomal protein S20 [Anaerolineales bacterium]|nr:30S ribosomal protein S20 [Anaerolineales bacterium]MCX7608100.1 30S ribosomal protein S20 [Anaerolineales bacterium]MDW8228053.1 30S ribosomal protein S20 [Anaerolineales bacterium]